MSQRLAGISLVLAATLFWFAWALMPGVGITDAGRALGLSALGLFSLSQAWLGAALWRRPAAGEGR